MNLDSYIDFVSRFKNENNLTELELIRYIYVTLGKKLYYDVDFWYSKQRPKKFSGNSYFNSKIIYARKKINCYTSAYLLDYILHRFGINTYIENDGEHYSNVIILPGSRPNIDLQLDLYKIHFNMMTEEFKNFGGLLKNIDRKIGYIEDDYFDKEIISKIKRQGEFITRFEKTIDLFNSVDSKIGFIENINCMKYILRNCFIYETGKIKHATLKDGRGKYLSVFSLKRVDTMYLSEGGKYIPIKKEDIINILSSKGELVSGQLTCGEDIF